MIIKSGCQNHERYNATDKITFFNSSLTYYNFDQKSFCGQEIFDNW